LKEFKYTIPHFTRDVTIAAVTDFDEKSLYGLLQRSSGKLCEVVDFVGHCTLFSEGCFNIYTLAEA